MLITLGMALAQGVEPFERLEVDGKCRVAVSTGPLAATIRDGSPTLLVTDGVLRVRSASGPCTVDVVAPRLIALIGKGGSAMHLGPWSGATLSISLIGATVDLKSVRAESLSFELASAAVLRIDQGEITALKGEARGASTASLEAVATSGRASLTVSGASSIALGSTGSLKVTASGASAVRYRGKPSPRSIDSDLTSRVEASP